MSQISLDFTTSFVASRGVSPPPAETGDSEAFAERLQGAAVEQSRGASPADEPAPTDEAEAVDAEPEVAAAETAGADEVEQEESTGDEPVDEAPPADAAVAVVVAPVLIEETETPTESDGAELPEAEALLGESDGDDGADSSAELADAELLVGVNQGEGDAAAPGEGELEAVANEQADTDAERTQQTAQAEEAPSNSEVDAAFDVLTEADGVEQSATATSSAGADVAPEPANDSAESVEPAQAVTRGAVVSEVDNGADSGASAEQGATQRQESEPQASAEATPTQASETSREPAAVESAAPVESPVEAPEAANAGTPDAEAAPVTRDDNRTNQALARIAAGRVDQQNASEGGGPRVDAARFVSRVAGAFQAAQERGGEVRIRLSPPELGVLQVKITVADGVLNASLETENAAARNTILDNLPALRERLAEQEIRIEKFDVDVRDEGQGAGQDFSADERRDREPRGDARGRTPGADSAGESEAAVVPLQTITDDGQINLIA